MVAYDELVALFGEATEPALREDVAKALVNKGITLAQLGRLQEAAQVYDQVVARFGSSDERALGEQVARALAEKGAALGNNAPRA
jgi:tetratricopeptide (TPR) repeat protein